MIQTTTIPTDKNHWLELRSVNLNSTETPALFGLSPYITEFELWHIKAQKFTTPFSENERTKWGIRLEASIANGIAEDQGWKVRKVEEYISLPELRLGSSFDFAVTYDNDGMDLAILEIKNVDSLAFKQGWLWEDGNLEAPPHIEIQAQHQMLVKGLDNLYIGALVGGNNPQIIQRTADKAVQDAIKEKSAKFWESIKSNAPPSPDFKKDAEFISKLYGFSEPGKIFDARNEANAFTASRVQELVNEYKRQGELEKSATILKKAAKAEILTLVGDVEKVLAPSFTISMGMIGPVTFTTERKGYRDFKVYTKKEKE